jgi:hypothetical protein
MPFFQYQLFVVLRKLLGLGQVAKSETVRFPQFDTLRDLEDRFGTGFDHVNMNRLMVVTIKCETESVLFEDFGHFAMEAVSLEADVTAGGELGG